MRQDNKTDMTFCKILFSLTPNELVDSEQDLTVVSILKKLQRYGVIIISITLRHVTMALLALMTPSS